jgi:transposase
MKISVEERVKVKERYKSGDSIEDIAKHYDVTVQTIKNILKKFRFNLSSSSSKISDKDVKKIVKEYKKDDSASTLQKLAEEYEVTTVTIRNILKREKVYKAKNKKHIRLTDAQKKKVVERYKEGMSGRKISKEFGISYQTVYDLLKGEKVDRRKLDDYKRSKKISDDEEKNIVQAYKDGESSTSLAKKYSVSVGLILGLLKGNDVKIRPVKLIKEKEYDNIIDLYVNQKLSTYKIAEKYGVHANTIYAILKKLDVKLRPKWYKKIMPNEYHKILRRFKDGEAVEDIAKDYDVTPNSIKSILEKIEEEAKKIKTAKKK